MLIGTMNHPARQLSAEIETIAGMGFDFIDLTLEPPCAGPWQINVAVIRSALQSSNLKVVGHTAYYLPLCHPFESVRRMAVEELKSCLKAFAALGAKWVNFHPDFQAPFHEHQFIIERNLQSISELLRSARELDVGLMVENLPGLFNTAREVSELLEPLPDLGLHLDIGHANLMVGFNTTDELLKTYGNRLRHVHLHDNKGGNADLHLPLGAGMLDTAYYVRALQAIGYDGTISLEVFTPDRGYLAYSRDVLRRVWDECARQAA
jgi:sugar phosphate isomerase/epimerase